MWLKLCTGSNVLPIARFLQMTHSAQALVLDENSSDKTSRSVLSPLLPEAMIRYLENYGPEEFSQVFYQLIYHHVIIIMPIFIFLKFFTCQKKSILWLNLSKIWF